MANWVKTELLRGKTADADFRQGTAQEVHSYKVYFDDVDADAYQAILADDVPAKGQQLGSTALYVAQVKAKQNTDDPSIFDVDVTYTPFGPSQIQMKPTGATKWNVEISGNSVAWQEEVHQDRDGKPIQNVNGEAVTPALQKTGRDERIQVSYFCVAPDWATLDACRGKTNNSTITLTINGAQRTFPPNTLLLDDTSWGRATDADGNFVVQIVLIFWYKKDGWTNNVPNISYYQKTPSGKLTPFLDASGNPKTTPTYLGADGKPLPDGTQVYRLSFDIVETTSFTSLLSELT